jgi:hypothetical protein
MEPGSLIYALFNKEKEVFGTTEILEIVEITCKESFRRNY